MENNKYFTMYFQEKVVLLGTITILKFPPLHFFTYARLTLMILWQLLCGFFFENGR